VKATTSYWGKKGANPEEEKIRKSISLQGRGRKPETKQKKKRNRGSGVTSLDQKEIGELD